MVRVLGMKINVKNLTSNFFFLPRGDGGMDSKVACCAGGPGSIPAVGVAKQGAFQMVFLSA